MMQTTSNSSNAAVIERFRDFFVTRDFLFHDGRGLRRFSLSGRVQAWIAGAAVALFLLCLYGAVSATTQALIASGALGDQTPAAKVARMERKVAQMQSDVVRLRRAAAVQAARVEKRQALLAAALTGDTPDAETLRAAFLDDSDVRFHNQQLASTVLAPLDRVEQGQAALAAQTRRTLDARYRLTASSLRRMGLDPARLTPVRGAMGGPFEPIEEAVASGDTAAPAPGSEADAQFRSLFMSWKKLDSLEQAVIAVPAAQPVDNLTLTSTFGVRSDPFRGTAAMHAGIDIPGAIGTPIYATADGIVGRSGRYGGYGNLVEINHGKGIETRYGHLSKIMVQPNTRVRRGQIIGLMGSTGRSTGSHLHYEVRIDGRAVNPVPYLQAPATLLAAQDRAADDQVSVGGPTGASK
jgi:murein DD-endopeptidase MepM/ murein hydrolase activator NlpD